MNGQALQNSRCPEEIRVLTFTVMGVKIGVDAEQIREMMDVEMAKALGLTVSHFHERISFGATPPEYHAPKVIMIKDEKAPYAVVIDMPDDITAVNVNSIQPLPPLIVMTNSSRAFWGTVVMRGEVILLMDFFRLAGARQRNQAVDHQAKNNEEVQE